MRILHTADWHVGKRLGRYDRTDDHAAVLDEVVEIADAENVDLVIVAGDLTERPHAPIDVLRLVLDTLERLARPERPVVAIAGNHDSPELFELLAPLLEPRNVHLVGRVKKPDEGGVLELVAGGERALVAAFPFLRQGQAVDFLAGLEKWHGEYAERLGRICEAYDRYLGVRAAEIGGAVKLFVGHFMVSGVHLGGHGQPRGERTLHLGDAYAASENVLPPGPQYVAMGHIHAPQPVPGSGVPALYSGSLLELDFGEAGEEKRVVIVDVEAGGRASTRSMPLTRGRRLRRVRGRFEELTARGDLRDAYLDLVVESDGPDPGLADRAREAFPYLVKVRLEYERGAEEAPVRTDQPWDALYRDYHRRVHGAEPTPDLVAAFNEIFLEVSDASPTAGH